MLELVELPIQHGSVFVNRKTVLMIGPMQDPQLSTPVIGACVVVLITGQSIPVQLGPAKVVELFKAGEFDTPDDDEE